MTTLSIQKVKHLVTIIGVLTILSLVGVATQATDLTSESYDWSKTSNYSELRKAIGWSDDYEGRCFIDRPLADMATAMNEKNWQSAITLGESWVTQCPIDMRAHYYVGIALAELGQESESEDHFRWSRGLLDDLVASGDGKSCETAYKTISVSEEYDALYFFRLNKKSQSLVRADNASCDLIVATNEEEKEFSIYFNPEAHFARLEKLLENIK